MLEEPYTEMRNSNSEPNCNYDRHYCNTAQAQCVVPKLLNSQYIRHSAEHRCAEDSLGFALVPDGIVHHFPYKCDSDADQYAQEHPTDHQERAIGGVRLFRHLSRIKDYESFALFPAFHRSGGFR